MWVFSETGTAYGERLYAFTHRTFLEYFAAAHLATASDTPEELARSLEPHITSAKGWNLVADLAVQIKDRSSDRGADRIYATLLDSATATRDQGPLLTFLVECLKGTQISPAVLRTLIQKLLHYRITATSTLERDHPLLLLLRQNDGRSQFIAEEISNQIGEMVASTDATVRTEGALLLLGIGARNVGDFWSLWSAEQTSHYRAEIAREAAHSIRLRTPALNAKVITIEQALNMPDPLSGLIVVYPDMLEIFPIIPHAIAPLLGHRHLISETTEMYNAIGRYLVEHPGLPWARGRHTILTYGSVDSAIFAQTDIYTGLGIAAADAMLTEMHGFPDMRTQSRRKSSLPMPPHFRKLFTDWAKERIDFVEFPEE